MFPEKGKDRRWMQNMDGTEKSTQNCPGSFIDSWITPHLENQSFRRLCPGICALSELPTLVWNIILFGNYFPGAVVPACPMDLIEVLIVTKT